MSIYTTLVLYLLTWQQHKVQVLQKNKKKQKKKQLRRNKTTISFVHTFLSTPTVPRERETGKHDKNKIKTGRHQIKLPFLFYSKRSKCDCLTLEYFYHRAPLYRCTLLVQQLKVAQNHDKQKNNKTQQKKKEKYIYIDQVVYDLYIYMYLVSQSPVETNRYILSCYSTFQPFQPMRKPKSSQVKTHNEHHEQTKTRTS